MRERKHREYIIERAISEAQFIVENKATVRETAKEFKVSKSTVHNDCSKLLRGTGNVDLYTKVRLIMDTNKEERAIRGGLATKKKYKQKAEDIRLDELIKAAFEDDFEATKISEEEVRKYWSILKGDLQLNE